MIPTVLAAEWDTQTDMFDGETAKGPVPRFFSTDPEVARVALSSNPTRTHKDLQRIYSRLMVTENIPACMAFHLVLNPR